jgi:PAS domain-containing protein
MLVTDDEARSVDANLQAEALTGYSREELLRLQVMDLTPDTMPERGTDPLPRVCSPRADDWRVHIATQGWHARTD